MYSLSSSQDYGACVVCFFPLDFAVATTRAVMITASAATRMTLLLSTGIFGE